MSALSVAWAGTIGHMVETFLWLDGRLEVVGAHPSMAKASAALPPGSYTTLRTYAGRRVLRLAQHARRLGESLEPARPELVGEGLLAPALAAALERTAHAESRIRLTFAPPRLYVSLEPFTPLPPEAYAAGVACVSVPVHRENPHAKDTRFIATASATYASLPPGVEEGLMLAADGSVLEGLSSNFFGILGGTLRTEGERVLAGVTRSLVLEVAAGLMPVEIRAVTAVELKLLEEAFITSVSREILPVVRIDGVRLADGRPGPLTRRLIAAFAALVAREARALA
jgi:branched-chain amino acid aminotransferase